MRANVTTRRPLGVAHPVLAAVHRSEILLQLMRALQRYEARELAESAGKPRRR